MPRWYSTAIQSKRTRRRFDLARQLDRAAKQQQFLDQSGLAGIGVRNDRKGAPAQNLVYQGSHQPALAGDGTRRRSQAARCIGAGV